MKVHTEEEIRELHDWFKNQKLPESMRLDNSIYIPNVKDTVDSLIEQSMLCYDNPKMQGGIVLMKRIKSAIEEANS